MSEKRVSFGGRMGVLLVAAGSAVGLGNIWRFPCELGQNGGGAFLLIYFICAIVIGMPIMLAEFSLGRMGQSNVVGALKNVSGSNKYKWIGYSGVLCAFLIMGFYGVVCGWTLEYVYQAVVFGFSSMTPTDLSTAFTAFSVQPVRPILWTILFLSINCAVVLLGVKNGIERSSKILMPMLLIIIIILGCRSLTLPGGMDGLKFLFKPDFSKVTSEVVLNAMGQAFFSLSLGMGCMTTYGSYIGKDINLGESVVQVTVLDSLVSLLAAIAIFPAVFSLGINPSAGPELAFITLPNVFNQIPGGYIWAILFFVLLSIAALTSTISLLEVITAFMSEEWKLSRKKAAIIGTATIISIAAFASLSLGDLSDWKIFGMSFFDLLDNVTARIIMPLTGLAISLFVAWKIEQTRLKDEITNQGTKKAAYFKAFVFILRYITPLAIIIVFINQLLSWF